MVGLMPWSSFNEIPNLYKNQMKKNIMPIPESGSVQCKLCMNQMTVIAYFDHLRKLPEEHQIVFNILYYEGFDFANRSVNYNNQFFRNIFNLHVSKKRKKFMKNAVRRIMHNEGKKISADGDLKTLIGSKFVRSLIDEKFEIKSEYGDPIQLIKGDRHERRRKIVEQLRNDIKIRQENQEKKREKIRKENEGKIREKSPIVIDDDSEPEFFIGNTNDSNQEFFTGNPVPENNDEFEISSVLDNDEIVFVSEKIPKKRKISPEKNSSEKRPKIKAESSRHFEEPEVKSLAGTFSSNFFQAFQKPIEIPDCIVIDESDDNFDLSNLKEKSKDESRAFLKASRKKNEHCELSLICPIDDKRVVYPVRGKECAHKEIFDAKTFLDRKLKNCPICTSPLIFT
jgi:hypothetical protein